MKKEEQARIMFLVREVMSRTGEGASIEIKDERVEVCVTSGSVYLMCHWMDRPIKEEAVYEALCALDEALAKKREEEEKDDQVREQPGGD